jgi:fibronectin-binding autotransporter adhesin
MSMNFRQNALSWKLAGILLLGWLLSPSLVAAQTRTYWRPDGDGVWFDTNNWTDGATATTSFPIPNSAGAWATFGAQTGPSNRTITVDGTATLGRLSFTAQHNYNLNSGGINLTTGGSNRALIDKARDGITSPTGNAIINTPLTVIGTANAVNIVNENNTGTLTIASLAGSGSRVTINSYTGTGVTGNAGTTPTGLVVIQSGTYGGTGSITEINTGILRADEGTGLPTNTLLRINGTTTSGAGWEVTQDTVVTRSLGSGTGNIQILGTTAGFAAFNGSLTLNLNGGGTIQWGSANFNPTSSLQFGRSVTSSGSSDNYFVQNGIDLNGAVRTIRAAGGSVRAYVNISGNIINTSGSASGLTITNGGNGLGGTVELSGTNTYNGTTTVTGFTILRANEGAGLSANSNLLLNGSLLEGNGDTIFSRTLGSAAGQVRLTGGTAGFAAFGGTHTIQLNGGTNTVVWGSTDFLPTAGSTLQFNFVNSTGAVNFQNDLDLNAAAGSARLISVRDNVNNSNDLGWISGVISNSAGAGILVIGGNGRLELTATNTYTGATVITDSPTFSGNILKLVGSGSIARSTAIDVGVNRFFDVSSVTGGENYSQTAGRFALASGQTLSGSGTVLGSVLVGSGATIRGGSPSTLLNDPTGQLTIDGALRLSDGGTLAVDLNGASLSGATVGRLAVIGAGNSWDIDATGGIVKIRLLNDQALVQGQSYNFVIASSLGGFTRNGLFVSSYTPGVDFELSSVNFGGFQNISLTVSGSNLVLQFVPVPEPAMIGFVAVFSLSVYGRVRKRRLTKVV